MAFLVALAASSPRAGATEPLDVWNPRTSTYGTASEWRSIAFGNGRFVVVSATKGNVITSANGTDWEAHSTGSTKALYALAFGAGKFVAAGYGGAVFTSTDGSSWQPQESETSAHLYGISYGGSQFVTAGEKGAIVSSPDGVSWTLRSTASTNEWLGTAFGNGINLIVGYRTESLFSYMRSAASPTLGNWDVRDTGPLMYHSAAVYGAGKFVACGYGGILQTSTDGVTWSPEVYPVVAWLKSIAYANGTFVTAGASGTILSSSNGTDWFKRHHEFGNILHGVAYGNNTWVVVGNKGLIFQSDPVGGAEPAGKIVLTDAVRSGSQFSFRFNSTAGKEYRIETSNNFTDWDPVQEVVASAASTPVTLNGQTQAGRFYRVVEQ